MPFLVKRRLLDDRGRVIAYPGEILGDDDPVLVGRKANEVARVHAPGPPATDEPVTGTTQLEEGYTVVHDHEPAPEAIPPDDDDPGIDL